MPNLNHFVSRRLLEHALAERIAGLLREAIRWRGAATIVVSGGRTPVALFERLSTLHLPWASVSVALADERWVDENHEHSNARLVRRHLLRGAASAARFTGLKSEADDPTAAVDAVEARLAGVLAHIDLVLLGMGEDGHTASLIPGAAGMPEALTSDRSVAAIVPAPPLEPRISLTPKVLCSGRRIIVHITGATKRAVLARALAPEPARALPVRCVLHQNRVPCEVYWAP